MDSSFTYSRNYWIYKCKIQTNNIKSFTKKSQLFLSSLIWVESNQCLHTVPFGSVRFYAACGFAWAWIWKVNSCELAGEFLTIFSARTPLPSCCYFYSRGECEIADSLCWRSIFSLWKIQLQLHPLKLPIDHLVSVSILTIGSHTYIFSFLLNSAVIWPNFLFRFFQIKQKRGRPPKHLPKEHDGDAPHRDRTTENAYRESSPDDFDEARNKSKRNRASEGTSSVAHKPSEQTLIGKLNTLCYFSHCSNI